MKELKEFGIELPKCKIFSGLDFVEQLGGFSTGELTMISGYTAQGKTSLALKIALCNAQNGVKVMFNTQEYYLEQMARRINNLANTYDLPIYLDDTVVCEDLLQEIETAAVEIGVKLFVIDYIDILFCKSMEKGLFFFETMMRKLKLVATRHNVHIICVAAANRLDCKPSLPLPTRPAIENIKCGEFCVADNILFVYRPYEYYKRFNSRPDLDPSDKAEIILAKGRNIGTGSDFFLFDKKMVQFQSWHTNGNTLKPKLMRYGHRRVLQK